MFPLVCEAKIVCMYVCGIKINKKKRIFFIWLKGAHHHEDSYISHFILINFQKLLYNILK